MLSVPFVLVAIRAYRGSYEDSVNAQLVHRAHLIQWGSSNLSFVSKVYPPLPTAVAAALPNARALGIVGALAAGLFLEALAGRLAHRGYPIPVALVLIAAFALTPSFAMTATTNLPTFMALTLLVLALDGYLRFAFRAQTHGGFQAGLAIGLACLCNPGAIIMAAGFAAAAPLIAHRRYRGLRAAGRATAAVLLFPTAAGIAGWSFLCWRFAGDALAWLRSSAPALFAHRGALNQLHDAMTASGRGVLLTPIYLLAIGLLITRGRIVQSAGVLLPVPCLFLATWAGLSITGLTIAAILGAVGLASLPARPSRPLTALIVCVALAASVLKWTYPPTPPVLAWQELIGLR